MNLTLFSRSFWINDFWRIFSWNQSGKQRSSAKPFYFHQFLKNFSWNQSGKQRGSAEPFYFHEFFEQMIFEEFSVKPKWKIDFFFFVVLCFEVLFGRKWDFFCWYSNTMSILINNLMFCQHYFLNSALKRDFRCRKESLYFATVAAKHSFIAF